jgi:protein phosphatase
MIAEAQVEEILESSSSLEEAGHALIDAANDAGGRDNITVVLFRLDDIEGAAEEVEEQDTMAGDQALTADDVQAALEAQERRGDTVVEDRPDPDTVMLRRIEPTPPPGPAERQRRHPRLRRALLVTAVVGAILVPIALGAYVAIRSVYFVGADDQGFVTVYRGLPYELPLGIELYQENYSSPVHEAQIPAARRDAVLDQEWRSQEDAYDLVEELERGELS